VTPRPTPTLRPPLPGLRLPLGRRRIGPGAAAALLIHALIITLLLVHGRELLQRLPGDPGRGGGGGGRPQVNFFTLPSAGPTAVAVPAAPAIQPSDLRALPPVKLDLPTLDLVRETRPLAPLAPVAVGSAGSGQPGAGGGQGGGVGGGTGADVGPGTGGEGGYIFVASPRTAILPPLAKVPGSVAGRSFVVKFWVAADGRVTRVEVDPPIVDAAYRREFAERMLAYQFYPAHTRDGRNVASVVTVPLRIGN
jgi:hypothetical protein